MTIQHHASDELLLDYAAGSLGEAWSLAIATHLALCPVCRRSQATMEGLGGAFMESVTPSPLDPNAFEKVMSQLENTTEDDKANLSPVASNSHSPVLPEPLRGTLGGDLDHLNWQRLGQGAFQILIPMNDKGAKARLLRIPAGKPVPEHSHGGLELTMVLCGAFTDNTGRYGRGDLQEADENLLHQPHAEIGEDCVCLAVTDAPLRFRSIAARLVQPFLGI